MTRRIIMTITLLLTVVTAMTAQNQIDNMVDKYSATGYSKFTSAVERDPKTRAVVKVVKVLELTGTSNIASMIKVFTEEAGKGDFTEKREGGSLTMMLTTKRAGRNCIYMLKAQGDTDGRYKQRYDYSKVTIIIRYR